MATPTLDVYVVDFEEGDVQPLLRDSVFPAACFPIYAFDVLTEAAVQELRLRARALGAVMGVTLTPLTQVAGAQWLFSDTATEDFGNIAPENEMAHGSTLIRGSTALFLHRPTDGEQIWTTAEHVQLAVRFAATHNLCVAVAGTGHDFMNRHSCDNGVFIRTTLLKEQVWNLDDPRWPDGSVRLGAGTTFRECSNGRAASS